MTILINKKTKIIIQGITGHHGQIHAKIMKEYGTQIVAGVTPGKGNQTIEGIPVYNSVKQALKKHNAEWSMIFVPARFAKSAAIEALKSKLNIVLVTEHLPIHDAIEIKTFAKKQKCKMIGPNSPGIIAPGRTKLGIMPHKFFTKGKIGVMSRSGTLTYEIVNYLTKAGLGQSTVIGIGGDGINGTSFIDALKLFAKDKETKAIVMVGEIGGTSEEDTATFIKRTKYKKPIIAYIGGQTAPPGKRMGHAGALITGKKGTADTKIAALKDARVTVIKIPQHVAKAVKRVL